MTTKQVVKTSVTVNNSPIQDYIHPDNHTQLTYLLLLLLLGCLSVLGPLGTNNGEKYLKALEYLEEEY